MGKLDLIALSQKKGYRLTMIILAVVGVLILAVGLIMRMSVTKTVMPNQLDIDCPGITGVKEYGHYADISVPIYLTVNTGTNDKALSEGIRFVLDKDAKQFLKPMATGYRGGLYKLELRDDAIDGATGTLTVYCGSFDPVKLTLTYTKPTDPTV